MSPPSRSEIVSFLKKFSEDLNPNKLIGLEKKVIGLASSHHRFLWLHPFPDGNGRVVRLFTLAYFNKIGIKNSNLWSISRFFARNRKLYDQHLSNADQKRRNDLDGRGPLSEEELVALCKFFLKGCLDQIEYMKQHLSLKQPHFIKPKYLLYLELIAERKKLSKTMRILLKHLFDVGEIQRRDVQVICHITQRQASTIISHLLKEELIQSPSKTGPLRIQFTSDVMNILFDGSLVSE